MDTYLNLSKLKHNFGLYSRSFRDICYVREKIEKRFDEVGAEKSFWSEVNAMSVM